MQSLFEPLACGSRDLFGQTQTDFLLLAKWPNRSAFLGMHPQSINGKAQSGGLAKEKLPTNKGLVLVQKLNLEENG